MRILGQALEVSRIVRKELLIVDYRADNTAANIRESPEAVRLSTMLGRFSFISLY